MTDQFRKAVSILKLLFPLLKVENEARAESLHANRDGSRIGGRTHLDATGEASVLEVPSSIGPCFVRNLISNGFLG